MPIDMRMDGQTWWSYEALLTNVQNALKKDTPYSKWLEVAGMCVRIYKIWRKISIIFGTNILSFLFSRMLDHMAVGQVQVNYSLPTVRHLFIVLHK